MTNYITKKHHDKIVAIHQQNTAELIIERDNAIGRANELERNRDYYKKLNDEKAEKLNAHNIKSNMAMGAEGARRDVLHEAAHSAHRELLAVKAGESSAVLLQRVIGAAQGILSAALGDVPHVNLYPGEETRDMMDRSFSGYGGGGRGRML